MIANTPDHELLLKAALLNGERARVAWEQWSARNDLQTVDDGSFRLLPLLYRNLTRLDLYPPGLDVMKGIHRHTWVKNQTMLHKLAPLLRRFHEAGVETLVLKGAALILRHYDDFGLRPMGDLDVLVPRKKAVEAVRILEAAGWTPGFRAPHAQAFTHSDGVEFDLHWNLFFENCGPRTDDDFWTASETTDVRGVTTRVLCPTDQLLHVCVHGARWNPIPQLRWLADAVVILKTSSVDWERLIDTARRTGVVLPTLGTLRYLGNLLDAPVPEAVLVEFERLSPSRAARRDYRAMTCPPEERGPALALWAYWREFVQWSRGCERTPYFWRFPGFLKHLWNLESATRVPGYVISGGLRRTLNVLKRTVNE